MLDKSLLETSRSTRLHQDGGRMISATRGPLPRVTHSSADRELLIRNILEVVRERRTTPPQRSQERELEFMLRDTLPVGSITEDTTSPPVLQPVGGAIPLTNDQWKRGPCFSCGLQGHGVNRCLRMDVSFLYLLPGWSVDVRNGQYRASRSPTELSAGKREMVRAEGSAARTIDNSDAPDPGGGKRAPGGHPLAW